MNVGKVALILGITMIGLLGTMHYMNSEKINNTSNSTLEIEDATPEIQERFQLFKEWMKEHKKVYGLGEAISRFAIWNENYEKILEHNAKGLSWTLGLNQFSDLTLEEFSAMYLGYKHDPNAPRNDVYLVESGAKPQTFDWRTKGAVTPVGNQGQCGSCYTWSAGGALEGIYKIKKGELIELSTSQQLDCTSSYGNQGCSGGLMEYCFKYTKEKGIMRASDYPYVAKVQTCKYNASKIVFKNTGYNNVPKNNPTQLKTAVQQQPIAVAVQASESAFQQYKSGIISSNCGTDLDHAIVLVGYGQDYWIVKNSWGTTWGEKGYAKIASGTQNNGAGVCGINSMASYPTY